jgi:hypothetical protein
MERKVRQIVRRGVRTWLRRVYNGRDPETRKWKHLAGQYSFKQQPQRVVVDRQLDDGPTAFRK